MAGLNEALWAKAAGAKLLRTARLRADTTVVAANVAYPTDSGLLARAVRRNAAAGRRIRAAGGATRTRVRDRSRAAGKRAHAIAVRLSCWAAQAAEEKQAAVARATGELADLAERAAAEARRLLASARRALSRADAKAAARNSLDRGCLVATGSQVAHSNSDSPSMSTPETGIKNTGSHKHAGAVIIAPTNLAAYYRRIGSPMSSRRRL